MVKLGKRQISDFKKTFEKRREEIIKSIQTKDINIDFEGDELDFVQGVLINDIREKLSLRDINLLAKINESLDKIDNGTFGNCEECGDQINEKRLKAVLGCSTCIDCAQDQEREFKKFA
jgi:DnaK suppressor protein